MIEIFLLLIFLQIKHWYIDFVNQTSTEVAGKGIYGNFDGINHSAKHGIGTMIAIIMALGLPIIALAAIIAMVDAILHYHIDWTKMNFGNRDIETPQFWNHLGLDQMAHQICYITYAWFLLT
jgi:hypothetical protein